MQLATNHQAMPIAWIDRLFQRLSAMYGQKFATQWAGVNEQAMKDVWAEGLSGFSGQEISTGLDSCKSRPFPPTLPEFLVLCRPCLDPYTAHQEAVVGMGDRKRGELGEWSHPAVYWAAVRVGSHDLLNAGWQAIKPRWEKALKVEMERGAWEEIPMPMLALPEPGKDVTANAVARKKIEQISAESVNRPKKDHKAWARKILAYAKDRSPAVVAMAQRALAEAV